MLQRMNGTIWLFISVFIRQTEKEKQTMSAEYYLYGTIALYICPHKWNRFSVGVGWYLTAFCLHSSSVYLNTIMHTALQKQRLHCVGSESEKKKKLHEYISCTNISVTNASTVFLHKLDLMSFFKSAFHWFILNVTVRLAIAILLIRFNAHMKKYCTVSHSNTVSLCHVILFKYTGNNFIRCILLVLGWTPCDIN